MKIGKWLLGMLASVSLVTGCGNFWLAPGSSGNNGGSNGSNNNNGGSNKGGGGCTTGCANTTKGEVYVLNEYVEEIAAYAIVNGTLTSMSGSPYTLFGTPYAVAVSPQGNFLYVSTTTGIYLYTVNTTTGALTAAQGVFYSDKQGLALQVDPSGAWLLDASGPNALGKLSAIPITSSGILDSSRSVQSVSMASTQVNKIVISPNNQLLALALGSAGTQVFPFTSGNPAPVGAAYPTITPKNASSGTALSVAVDPQNRLLYIGESAAANNSGGLRIFTIASGDPQELSTSPYASGGLMPNAVLPDASGDYVYVANSAGSSSNGNITGFAVTASASTYSLTTGGTVATGINPTSLAEENTGTYLFVADFGGSPDLEAYTFSSTGALNSALTSVVGSDPAWAGVVAAAP